MKSQPASLKNTLTPKEFAKLVGVSTSTLRRWEREGVLKPQRDISGFRVYSIDDKEKAQNYKEEVSTKKSFESKAHIYYTNHPKMEEMSEEKLPIITVFSTPKTTIPNKAKISTRAVILAGSFAFLAGTFLLSAFAGTLRTKMDSSLRWNDNSGGKDILGLNVEALGISRVLAETSKKGTEFLSIRIPVVFKDLTTFEKGVSVSGTLTAKGPIEAVNQNLNLGGGKITAGNIIYGLVGGSGITVGEGQTPTIENSGVLSVMGETGDVELVSGAGIAVSGLTITNIDTGSAQPIFKNIQVGTDTVNVITATTNTDTLKLTAGSGMSITPDTVNKNLTFSAIMSLKEGGTLVSSLINVFDFLGGDFDLTETPAGEINITLSPTLTTPVGVAGNFNIPGTLGVGSTASFSSLVNVSSLTASQGVYTDANKTLTSTPPTTGTLGFWQRNGTYVSPATISDFVGIGTTAPVASLDVSGTAWIRGSIGGTAGLYVDASGNIGVGTTAPQARMSVWGAGTGTGFNLRLRDNTGADKVAFLDNGNVGIGITSPSALLHLYNTSNSTSFQGFNLDWQPSVATALTGDLFKINIGSLGTASTLFNVYDNGSSVFSVSQTQINSNLPHAFNSAGDVSMAYDLIMTNQTASNIKSYGPLTIDAGENWESNDLTLRTYGAGNLVLDIAGGNIWSDGTNVGIGTTSPIAGFDVQKTTWLRGALAGTGGIYVDALGNVGIGTTAPAYQLQLTGTLGVGSTATFSSLVNVASLNASQAVYTDANKNLTSTVPTSGILGYWNRAGTTLTPSNIGDNLGIMGNVGVGTTSPEARMSIWGVGSAAGFTLRLRDNTGADKVAFLDNGNVGIGTTTPVTSLEVVGPWAAFAGSDGNFSVRSSDTAATGKGGFISLGGSYTGTSRTTFSGISGAKENSTAGNIDGYMGFYTNKNGVGTAEKMRIDSNGNVGIGTTSPNAPLDINSSIAATTGAQNLLNLKLVSTGVPTAQNFGNGINFNIKHSNGVQYDSARIIAEEQAASYGQLKFQVSSQNGGGLFTAMTIAGFAASTQPNVGIGLSVPQVPLHVAGSVAVEASGSAGPGSITIYNRAATNGSTLGTLNFRTNNIVGYTESSITGVEEQYKYGALLLNTMDNGTSYERLRINSVGNVGIGTTSPGTILDIAGTGDLISRITSSTNTGSSAFSAFNDNASYVQLKVFGSSFSVAGLRSNASFASKNSMFFMSDASVQNGGTNSLNFMTGGWDTTTQVRMSINSSGNVGIGTTGPGYLLDLQAPAGSTNIESILRMKVSDAANDYFTLSNGTTVDSRFIPVFRSHVESTNVAGVQFITDVLNTQDTGTGAITQFYSRLQAAGGGAFSDVATRPTYQFFNNGTAQMTILASGNVGIGTTGPSYKLDAVNTNDNATIAMFEGGNSNAIGHSTALKLKTWNYNGIDSNQEITGIAGVTDSVTAGSRSTALVLYYANQTTGFTEGMRISGTGNVGIGTTNPGEKLTVSSGSSYGLGVYNQSNSLAALIIKNSGTAWGIYDDTSSKHYMAGNVGIGTTSPGAKLEINNATNASLKLVSGTRTMNFNAYAGDINYLTTTGAIAAYGATDAQDVYFYTNNLRRLILKSNGDVGLGGSISDEINLNASLVIKSGNVGIGTTDPTAKLQVTGTGRFGTGGTIDIGAISGAVTSNGTDLQMQGETGAGIYTYNSSFLRRMHFDTSGNVGLGGSITNTSTLAGASMVISSGNVGIGTTNPGAKLNVAGDISITGVAGQGLRFFDSDSYKILMGDSATYGKLDTTSDYNMYFQMTGGTNRGFVFKALGSAVAQIDSAGIIYGGLIKASTVGNNYFAGNVGIGTTGPGSILEVKQANAGGDTAIHLWNSDESTSVNETTSLAFKFSDTLTTDLGVKQSAGYIRAGKINTYETPAHADSFLSFATANDGVDTEYMRITNLGNIGIGTTSPTYKMDVNVASNITTAYNAYTNAGGNATFLGYDLKLDNSTANASGYLHIARTSGTTYLGLELGSQSRDGIRFLTHATTPVEVMRIDSNGNVGIGTTGPGSKLEVDGTSDTSTFPGMPFNTRIVSTNSAASGVGGGLIFSGSYTGTSPAGFAIISGIKENGSDSNISSALLFGTRIHPGLITEKMRITSSGNVGVGTTNPTSLLYVNGTMTASGAVTFLSSAEVDGTLFTRGDQKLLNNATSGWLTWATRDTSGSEAVYNLSNIGTLITAGNVGIGTTGPGAALEVKTNVAGTGTLQFSTDAYGGAIKSTSGSSAGTLYLDPTSGTVAIYDKAAGTRANLLDIYYGANANVRLRANGDSWLNATTGNVGIGTTAPGALLDVSGGTTNAATGIRSINTTVGTAAQATNRITADTVTATFFALSSGYTTNGIFAPNTIGLAASSPAGMVFNNQDSSTGFISFATGGYAAANERMRIDKSGNVGIGTTSPGAKLTISDTDKTKLTLYTTSNVQIYTSDAYAIDKGGTLSLGGAYFNTGLQTGFASIQGAKENATDGNVAGYMSLYTTQASVGSVERLRITSTGNVGIGTTGPTYKLDISNTTDDVLRLTSTRDIATQSQMYIVNNRAYANVVAGDSSLITFQHNKNDNSGTMTAGIGSYVFNPAASAGLGLEFRTGGSSTAARRMVIDNTGNVGIGTTNPHQKLEVAGEARITGLASANYNVCVDANGDLFESATACSGSDIALKENVVPLDGVLNSVLSLSPVSFDWIDKTGRGANREIGFIAQDMEKLFPQVVRTNPDGYKGIKYDVFSAVLTKAIQEQNLEIVGLKLGLENLTTSQPTPQISETSDILTSQSREIGTLTERVALLESMLGVGNTSPLGIGSTDVAATSNVANSIQNTNWRDGIAQLQEFANQIKQIVTLSSDNVAVDQNVVLYKNLSVLGKTTLADVGVTGKLTVGLLVVDGLENTGEELCSPENQLATLDVAATNTGIGSTSPDVAAASYAANSIGNTPTCGSKTNVSIKSLAGDIVLQDFVTIDAKGNVALKQGVIAGNSSFRDAVTVASNATEVAVTKTWDTAPITVTVTPSYEATVWVENITKDGFTIKLGTAPTEEQKVYWMAVW